MSLCSDPRISLPEKPDPYSKPMYRVDAQHCFAKVGMQLIKYRFPNPTGQFKILAAYLAANSIALFADGINIFYHFFRSSRSAQRTIFFSRSSINSCALLFLHWGASILPNTAYMGNNFNTLCF